MKVPPPRSSSVGEQFRRAEQTRYMRVVAAGMHDADGLPRIISCSQCRGVGQTCVFLDGKRIHVGPREHGPAFAVAKGTDDAGPPNPFEDFVTEFFQFRRRECGRFSFLKTQLGMCMELLIKTFLPYGDCL